MSTAWRLLRAFAWLRLRQTANMVSIGRRRDRLERLARASAVVVPVLLGLIVALLALAATAGAFVGGRAAATGDEQIRAVVLTIVRILLGAGTVAVLLAPILDATRGSGIAVARLVLLPIPRAWLVLGEIFGALTDPWLLVIAPAACIGLPAGLLAGGAWTAAAVTVLAGIGLVIALAALGALLGLAFALLLRDRKRGEMVRLLVLLGLTVGGFVPLLLEQARHRGEPVEQVNEERRVSAMASLQLPPWAGGLPSEMFGSAMQAGLEGRRTPVAAALLGLAAWGGGLVALAGMVHGRLLATPMSAGGRRRGVLPRVSVPRLPLMSQPASAVALAQVRHVLRTVRGRMAVFVTPVVMVVAGVLVSRMREGVLPAFVTSSTGAGIVALAIPACLLALEPATMNQFAVDRAGLRLELLLPLSEGELLRGKAAGGVVLSAMAMMIAVLLGAALMPTGEVAAWAASFVGGVSAAVLLSPLAALVSLVFPRKADLSQVGREGNAHPAASLIGAIVLLAALVPPLVLMLVGRHLLGGPWMGLLLVTAWLIVAFGAAWLLLIRLESVLASRRENLALVTQGS